MGERNPAALIAEALQHGAIWNELANDLGVSASRVHQIVIPIESKERSARKERPWAIDTVRSVAPSSISWN